MLQPADRVVAGVSGGADSVCLFLLLLEYAKRCPLSLAVAHVNHCIRAEAGEDARFVAALCKEKGIPFFLEEADVRGLAAEFGYSEEDAGRRLRYGAFYRAAGRLGGAKIAVAHNCNDNAETMLFHLFRGSGLQGLGGIAPVRGEVIRPLLCLERREVEAYLECVGASWRRDATNEGDTYRRNRIRHHILPYAEAEIVPGAVGHMGRTAELLRETEEYLAQQTRGALARCAEALPDGGIRIGAEAFAGLHPALRGRALLTLLKELSPTGKDISAVHVTDVLELLEKRGNRSLCLPFGIRAWRQYDSVTLARGCGDAAWRVGGTWRVEPVAAALGEEIFRHSLVYDLGDWGKIEFMGIFIKKGQEVPIKRYTKWLDYDKIKECVTIRPRRQGDYLTIAGRAGGMSHKSLKEYMITEKIPRQCRDAIPVVAAGSHVLWLAGGRISESFKVDGNTERVVQMKLLGAREDSKAEEKDGGEH